MKYIFYSCLAIFSFMHLLWVSAADPLTQDEMRSWITPAGSNSVITSTATWESLLDAVLEFIKDGMFRLLALIAIGMFLYIWWRLLMARWNPEEFKKAMLSFLYAWIWLFVVAAAWAVVRFIAWIDIL